MPYIFPRWTNRLPLIVITVLLLGGGGVTAGMWYYFSPKYTRVGYQPIQPVGFPHSVHVNQLGLHCHDRIDTMEEVYHAKPLSMTFCLDCHRQPAAKLRPLDKITDLGWNWDDDPKVAAARQSAKGNEFVEHWKVQSLQSCSACHR